MKRFENGMKIISGLVFIIILGILVFTGYKVYHDTTSGNFTSTPEVTLESIKKQAKKDNILIIFYQPDTEETKALKPEVSKRIQLAAGNSNAPKVVYVSVANASGVKLLKHFGGEPSMAPIAMPVLKGGWDKEVNISDLRIQSDPIDWKQLASDSDGEVMVFKDYLDIYFNGTWSKGQGIE
jgi:hypothetical protein